MKFLVSVLVILFLVIGEFTILLSKENHFEKGLSAFFRKKYIDAVKHFDKALTKGDTTFEILYYRGLANLYAQRFEDALNDFDICIRLGYETPDLFQNRALAYFYLGDLKLAFDDFTRAISLDSNFAEAFVGRASVNIETGEYSDAIDDLNKAIKKNPKNPLAYYERGRAYYKLKNYEKAIHDFDKCEKLKFKNPKLYYNRGNAYYKLEKYELAIRDYSKCLELDSNEVDALNNRAVSYDKIGKKELANADRRRLARILGNENLFVPIDEISFVEFTDTLNAFKIMIPRNWYIFQKYNSDFDEVIISPERIVSDTDSYSVGVKLSFNRNMGQNYNVKTQSEIMDFWRGSLEKNANEYHHYRYLQQKIFMKQEYTGNIFETLVQFRENGPLYQFYELALTKEDTLFYGFFQSPANQFSYFREIFDRIIKSLEFLK
ncbi:MAG: tetratricopeptide repeat protein [Ignavibacteria bacterium]|nr:tetratricopeptide repeat protein [Ignavibacteria bacterium]